MAFQVVSWGFVVLGLGGIAYVLVKKEAKWQSIAALAVIAGIGGFGPSFLNDSTDFLNALHKVMTAAEPSEEDQQELADIAANADLPKASRELAARALTANPTANTLEIIRTAAREAKTDEGRAVLEERLRSVRIEMEDASKAVGSIEPRDPGAGVRGFSRMNPKTTILLERYRVYLTPERLRELGVDEAAAKRLTKYEKDSR